MSEHLVNRDIKSPKVRLVHEGQNTILTIKEALAVAADLDMDLVQVGGGDGVIPVCKVMDYAQFVYQQKQAEKAKKKAQRQTQHKTKEIQLSVDIQANDMDTKKRSAIGFLEKGHKVNVSIRLKGRAKGSEGLAKLAEEKIANFAALCGISEADFKVTRSGDTISTVLGK